MTDSAGQSGDKSHVFFLAASIKAGRSLDGAVDLIPHCRPAETETPRKSQDSLIPAGTNENPAFMMTHQCEWNAH
jgi:hypothetical protein